MTTIAPKSHDAGVVRGYPEKIDDGFIRVLELEPGLADEQISCNLRVVSLAEAEDTYEAISYAWGDPKDLVNICCSGKERQIPKSLALALKAIRHAAERLILWADSICINQKDDEEKAHQIKQMGSVYQNAKSVIVYLGLDDDKIAHGCFDLMKSLNQHYGRGLVEYGHPLDARITSFSGAIHSNSPDCMQTLYAMPWFHRLWVVQEAGLAKRCVVIWGTSRIDFVQVAELVQWLRCRPDISQGTCPGVDLKWTDVFLQNQCTLSNTTTWRRDLPLCAWFSDFAAINEENRSLIEVLRAGRKMNATDPRDRIYGFLGNSLARNSDGSLIIEPDYTRTAKEVYFDLACAVLGHPQEASFLLGAVDHSSSDFLCPGSGWPSWVPRWDQSYWTVPLAVPYNWYYAGGPRQQFTAHVLHGNLLSIKGIIFDRLSWVSSTLPEPYLSVNPAQWAGKFHELGKTPFDYLWEEVQQFCLKDNQNLEDRFMMTLCREYPSTQAVRGGSELVNLSILRRDFQKYRNLVRRELTSYDSQSSGANTKKPDSGRAGRFANKLAPTQNRKIAHTDAGRLMLTPRFAEPGDICCVFLGASVPYVLRESSEQGVYYLVGDSYVNGAMRGEIVQQVTEGTLKLDTIIVK